MNFNGHPIGRFGIPQESKQLLIVQRVFIARVAGGDCTNVESIGGSDLVICAYAKERLPLLVENAMRVTGICVWMRSEVANILHLYIHELFMDKLRLPSIRFILFFIFLCVSCSNSKAKISESFLYLGFYSLLSFICLPSYRSLRRLLEHWMEIQLTVVLSKCFPLICIIKKSRAVSWNVVTF